MKNYFDKLQSRVNKYKIKYADKPKKVAMKLMWWNLKCIFRRHKNILNDDNKNALEDNKRNSSKEITEDKIALSINGGIGDYLIAINYALYLYEYLDKRVIIDIFTKNPIGIKQLIGNAVPFEYYQRDDIEQAIGYAVKINLNRFPQIKYYNSAAIEKHMPKFINILNAALELYDRASMYFELDPRADSLTVEYARINGAEKRIQQPDIKQILNIGKEFKLNINPDNTSEILSKFNLNKTNFITLNRGTDTGNKDSEVTRMWPVEYYDELVLKLKQKYPNYKIVQLGYSKSWCKEISGVDFDLRGQTQLVDLKAILYKSALHIDYEGGMVHLRKALNAGKSVVLFGPTNPEWLGYDTNVNICTYSCRFCENLNSNWQKFCSNYKHEHICMRSITPELVLQEIEKFKLL